MATTHSLYVNKARTVLVTLWDNEGPRAPQAPPLDNIPAMLEVATRDDSGGSWGPPVVCHYEGRG